MLSENGGENGRAFEIRDRAFSKLVDLVLDEPEEAWEIVLEILRNGHHPRVLEALAAGPLEDLLSKHGPTFIERFEEQAKQDPQFKDLLGGVWKHTMRDDIWERLQKVTGPQW